MYINNPPTERKSEYPQGQTWSYLRDICRLVRLPMSLLLGLVGCAGASLSQVTSISDIAYCFATGFLVGCAGFTINDLADTVRDKNLTYKPIAACRIKHSTGLIIGVLFSILSILSSAQIGAMASLLVVVQLVFLVCYSKIKERSALAGNAITGALCGSGFLLGSTILGEFTSSLQAGSLCAMIIFSREIAKDIIDIKPDSEYGLRTLPVVLGIRKASMVITGVLFVCTTSLLFIRLDGQSDHSRIVLAGLLLVVSIISATNVVRPRLSLVRLYLNTSAVLFAVMLTTIIWPPS